MKGTHLLADVINIKNQDSLKTVDSVKPLMEKIMEEMDLHVVGHVYNQFEPYGATCLYLLSESHLSIHTYVEERFCAIDLYCCDDSIEMQKVLDIIYMYFNGDCIIKKCIIQR